MAAVEGVWPLDAVPYADALCSEYLLFRGCTGALQAFESERSEDKTAAFRVDKVMELLFQRYIPSYEAQKMLGLLAFLDERFFCRLEGLLQDTVRRLTEDTHKCYIVNALHNGHKDKVTEFFALVGDDLLATSDSWQAWMGLPYIKRPATNPQFAEYFTREWHDLLLLSWRNFLS